jgi:hypothetical protein
MHCGPQVEFAENLTLPSATQCPCVRPSANASEDRVFYLKLNRASDANRFPWNATPRWGSPAHWHMVLFVMRVEGLAPGLYARIRDEGSAQFLRFGVNASPAGSGDRLRAVCRLSAGTDWQGRG